MIEFCPAPVHFTGAVFVCVPEEILKKKAPKSGHVDGPRNSPTTAPLRPTTPKRASGNERVIKEGGSRGQRPRRSFLRLSPEKAGLPRRSRRGKPPGRACPAPVLIEPPTKPPGGNPCGIPVFFKNPCITLPALAQNRCSDDLPRWKDARIHKRMEGFSHETKTVAA